MRGIRQHSVVVLLGLVALSCALHFQSLSGEFVIDDSVAILKNPDMWEPFLSPIPWTNDFWGAPIASDTSHKSYRPLTVLTFRAEFQLAGFQPFLYHLSNALWHGLACWLVWVFAHQLFSDGAKGQGISHPAQSGGKAKGKKVEVENTRASLVDTKTTLATLLFAVHPVHTEGVCSIVGRAEVVTLVAVLSSLLWYSTGKGRLGTMCLFVVASLCKEIGYTTLIVCCAYRICMVEDWHVLPLRTTATTTTTTTTDQRQDREEQESRGLSIPLPTSWSAGLWYDVATFAAATLLWLAGMMHVRGWSATPVGSYIDNPFAQMEWSGNKFLSILQTHWVYLRLLVWPSKLSSDYSYNAIPLIYDVWDPANMYGVGCWVAVAAAVVFALFSPSRRELLFSLAFSLVAFIPSSHLFLTIGTVVAERLLYIPSVGFCLFVASVSVHLCQQRRVPGIVQAGFWGFVLLAGAYKSFDRGADWQTARSIAEATVTAYPNSAKAQQSIATEYLKTSEMEAALEGFKASVAIDPSNNNAWAMIGRIHYTNGDIEAATEALDRSLESGKFNAIGLLFKGVVLGNGYGDDDKALQLFRLGVEKLPSDMELQRALAHALYNTGRVEEAATQFEISVSVAQHQNWAERKSSRYNDLVIKWASVLALLKKDQQCLEVLLNFSHPSKLTPRLHQIAANIANVCENRPKGVKVPEVNIPRMEY